jgi:hypothetical protein
VRSLTRVLLHRLVDEVIDAALQLARHLLERVPKDVAALERAGALFVRVRAHRSLAIERADDSPPKPNVDSPDINAVAALCIDT